MVYFFDRDLDTILIPISTRMRKQGSLVWNTAINSDFGWDAPRHFVSTCVELVKRWNLPLMPRVLVHRTGTYRV